MLCPAVLVIVAFQLLLLHSRCLKSTVAFLQAVEKKPPPRIRRASWAATDSTLPATITCRTVQSLSMSLSGDNDIADPYDIATLLLNLVVDRRAEEVEDTFEAWVRRLTPSYKIKRQEQRLQIENLVDQLQQYGKRSNERTKFGKPPTIRPTLTYDVMESLLASGFFCTLYWYTPGDDNAPKPIWEQVSLKKNNIKGQQYYERNDFEEAVINYSEIWGRSIFLTAEGTFSPMDGILEKPNQSPPPKRNALSRLVPNSRSLRTCPDVFQVDATKVTLHILGFELELPIQGRSNLVILYADPRIRIFVSPIESKTVVGNWEEAGLVVVQVRNDLARIGSSQNGTPQDLR
ncbi:hypothetical protein IV203_022007 [Nitzschia inconspicua]|uniref:Uncharacterized protein n=1 Tax=Nitzschia inconspicua TaxID=303405 RepID=A0A9K3KHU6_9STRA|nr:hypothetical protein IV203_022007 [Nitzschia inconspicua]